MNGEGKKKPRKVRSDKKRDVNPTVPIELKNTVSRLVKITGTSEMYIAEQVCMHGISKNKILGYLAGKFRRTVRIDNTLYMGDIGRPSNRGRVSSGATDRIFIRFTAQTHETLAVLAWALDCSISKACTLLLDASIRDGAYINAFVRRYLEDNLDEEQMRELRKILKYVNADNPYNEEYSWAALLSFMVSEVKEASEKVSDTVSGFIVKHWRDK